MYTLKKGFSLIEIVVVISILAILGTFIVPAVQSALKKTKMAKDENNLRSLIFAYQNYTLQNDHPPRAEDIYALCNNEAHMHGLAAIFAKEDLIRKADTYYSSCDFRFQQAISGQNGYSAKNPPKLVLEQGKFNPDFYQSGGNSSTVFPLIFEGFLISEFENNSSLATTPLFFTRGIQVGGWGKENPYGEHQGGFIGFADGHIEWFDSLGNSPEKGKLVKYNSSEKTNNIEEAVPQGSLFLSAIGAQTHPNQ